MVLSGYGGEGGHNGNDRLTRESNGAGHFSGKGKYDAARSNRQQASSSSSSNSNSNNNLSPVSWPARLLFAQNYQTKIAVLMNTPDRPTSPSLSRIACVIPVNTDRVCSISLFACAARRGNSKKNQFHRDGWLNTYDCYAN